MQRNHTIADVLNRANATVAARKLAAPTTDSMTMHNLQVVIDNNMREYLPNLPRITVTAKPFSVFKKRITEAKVPLTDFVTFMIREWTAIASVNRASYMRDPAKTRKGSPLPPAPSFLAMAYRMPYFLAAYASHKVAGAKPVIATVDPRDQVIARLQAQLEAERKQSKTMAGIVRRSKPVAAPQPKPLTRVPRTGQRAQSLDDNWMPPTWEGNTK